MKEVNLADYIKGADPVQNRIGWLAAIAACKGQRAHALYTPDPNPGVLYKINLLLADKMSNAIANAGTEPGDRAIARFVIDWDLEIYGDGRDHSVLSFGTTELEPTGLGMQFAGLKMLFPYSLTVRGLRVTTHTPTASGTTATNYGIFIPPKNGNPSGENQFLMEKAKVDGYAHGVAAPSGPVNAINHTAIKLIDSQLTAQKITVGVWNDPNDDGTKTLHVERCDLDNTDKASGWGSHLMYIHENVSWRAVNANFRSWATAKFAIQNWGSNPNGAAKYSEAVGCHFDKSGDGAAIITSDTGPCQVRGGQVECRQGFQARQRLVASDVLFKPYPTIGGTIACLSTYDNAEVVARNLLFDMSEIGDNQATVFGINNNFSKWDIDGARVWTTKRTASLTIYGTAPNVVHGLATVKSRNVTVDGYHVPDLDYAAGVRSVLCPISGHQANWDLARQYFKGDMVSDRGAIRLDSTVVDGVLANALGTMLLEDVDVVALRGLGMYSDLLTAGKVKARRVKMHGARMMLVGGGYQNFRFDEATAPVPVAPVTTRRSSDWIPYQVLPISTDYDTVMLTGNPGDPPVNVVDICVNLIRKTITKPASPAGPSVTYTDVYSSEDTDNFVGAPLRVQATIDWLWRGTPVSAGKALTVQRIQGNWVVI